MSITRVGAVISVCIMQACTAAPTEEVERGSHGITPNDPSWGCYDPLPGHPTAADRESFLAEVAPAAQRAEAELGVPAAAIAAMAAVESGYDYTRIALYANNYFGFKMPSGGAGGRGAYTLACQPAYDGGNQYIVFASLEDSLGYVAYRLAASTRYGPVTQRYQADRAAGVDVVTAVNRWVEGITYAGYNPNHGQYISTITNAISRHDLYALSARRADQAAPVGGLGGGGGGAGVPPQQQPPVTNTWVAIDQPQEGETVSGTVPIIVTTGGGYQPVTKVVFYSVNSAGYSYQIATDSSPPFQLGWATAGWVANGPYRLIVEAYVGETKVATGVRHVYVWN